MPWESTISTYGLSKILQVSCHCCKQWKLLFKYVWSISVEKISFIRSCDVEEIKATDCIIKVHITSGNIKWRSFALRFCASNHKSAWQPLLPSTKGLSFTLCLLLLCKSQGDLHLYLFHFIIWQALCVGSIWIYIYIYIYIYPLGCRFS